MRIPVFVSQVQATAGTCKRGIPDREAPITTPMSFPTPWNQLEAGILFGLGLPLLIFREEGTAGGVFDTGVTDVFIHRTPKPTLTDAETSSLKEVFLKWHAKVARQYFGQ